MDLDQPITYKCPKCTGYSYEMHGIIYQKVSRCTFCYGKEELDWIEYIFGVKQPSYDFDWNNWS